MPLPNFLHSLSCGLLTTTTKQEKPIPTNGHPPSFDDDRKIPSTSPSISEDSLTSQSQSQKSSPSSSPSPNPQNKALQVTSKHTYTLTHLPFPVLNHENEIIISNRAVGLNPIDFKSVDYGFCMPSFPWVNGREMAGVVEVVGRDVKGTGRVRRGDRVWCCTYYRDPRAGTFQHYITVPSHTVLPIPPNLTFEQASCLGVAGLTAAMTLWKWLEIPLPAPISEKNTSTLTLTPNTKKENENEDKRNRPTLLIWGGSTITGQFATQIALLSTYKVIAVTSSKTAPLVRSLGAKVVIRDHKTMTEITTEILSLSPNITRAIDLVGPETARACLDCFSPTSTPIPGGHAHGRKEIGEIGGIDKGRCIFAPLAMMKDEHLEVAQNKDVEVVTVEMKRFVLDPIERRWAEVFNELVGSGRIKIPEILVLEGGLESVVGGLERLRAGEMGGVKLVVGMGN